MLHSEKIKEDWMNTKWRPMMGWCYMITCISDFIVFPVLWSILQAHNHGHVFSQWNPLTLQGAGLFHISMGAILGVTAWSRGQEKIAVINNPVPQTQPSITPQTQPQVITGFGGKPAPIPEEQPIK